LYKFVHPLKGNENLIDYNINNQAEPSVQHDLVRAKSSKKIIISKPYNLLQNQQGIIARKAIFNEDQFWGYISVALSLSEVLNQEGIPESNDGMQIALRFSGEKAFYGQDDLFKDSQSVHQSIALFDGQWEIAAIPSPNKLIGLKKEIILFRCSGGNKIRVFHPGMNQDANQKIVISNDLRLAIHREEFILHYQPQVDSRTGEITGVEALVRWNHLKKGFLSPAEFISVAEETGLIIDLGEWVLKRACLDMNSMIKRGLPLLPLAINLSARQFQDEALVCKMKKILKETEFPASLLEFEITESTAMKDDQLSILSEIQQLGINISIDDFGTHYSSLGYLKRFPVNKVKIDRSFIKGIQEDHKNLAILRAIIFVARDLGIDIIAEGVETEEEVQILSDYDCFNLQGFLYFRPLPFNELIDHLQS
jgi:EAL domain-containing protein (putative c-di-GMP-specific phosphodiesterase class I)